MNDIVSNVQTWLPFVSAFVIPFVVGLLYKASLPERGKATIMLLVTAVAALANQVDANAGILTLNMLYTWLGTVFITVSSYYGVWKPLGIGNIAPDKGIGPVD